MSTNNKLTRYQKEAIAIISLGTFLEYFDLMIYVHMSVLLNDLFFPKTDPMVAKLIGATAFCLTYVLRPVAGIVIGRIGDVVGRKFTIIITTSIMAISCVIMATLPTYAEVGIYATLGVMLCRMLQGFSSMGELMGAQLYLTEILKPAHRSVASGIAVFGAKLGGFAALGVASFTLSTNYNWRLAFWIGAAIAFVGFFARIRLRETPEFTNYQIRMKNKGLSDELSHEIKDKYSEKTDKKTLLAFAFAEFHIPMCFYITYVFLGNFMKEDLGMSSIQVINHNLKISIILATCVLIVALISRKIHPIKIAIVTALFFSISLPFIPYYLSNISTPFMVFGLQMIIYSFALSTCGTLDAIQYKYFPIQKRFQSIAVTFGITNPLSFAIVSFGLIPLVSYFGSYALWVILIPAVIGYWWAINYYKKLEIKTGRYHNYPNEDFPHKDTAGKMEDNEYENLEDEYEAFSHRCEYSTNLMNKLDEFSKEKNVKLNMKVIEKAITFAKKWHGTQMRKTGEHPFYWHPLKVAEMVAERYCKTDVIVAAILHDVVEDSECTVELIEKEFNARIAQIVDRLTNKRFENGKRIKLTLEETLNRLQEVGDMETLLIKQMDRVHNLETIEGLKPDKQKKMADESNNYFVKLIAIIGDKLGIHGKVNLENKMFQHCGDVLKKKINKD